MNKKTRLDDRGRSRILTWTWNITISRTCFEVTSLDQFCYAQTFPTANVMTSQTQTILWSSWFSGPKIRFGGWEVSKNISTYINLNKHPTLQKSNESKQIQVSKVADVRDFRGCFLIFCTTRSGKLYCNYSWFGRPWCEEVAGKVMDRHNLIEVVCFDS